MRLNKQHDAAQENQQNRRKETRNISVKVDNQQGQNSPSVKAKNLTPALREPSDKEQ